VQVPGRLRHVHASVAGRAVRLRRSGAHWVVVLRPPWTGRSVSVRYRGLDRDGRQVTITRRYAVCH
jgi:hypothetical protein